MALSLVTAQVKSSQCSENKAVTAGAVVYIAIPGTVTLTGMKLQGNNAVRHQGPDIIYVHI